MKYAIMILVCMITLSCATGALSSGIVQDSASEDSSASRHEYLETLLQPFDGKRNNFDLSVTTNKTVYYDDDELFITLRASEDCYFVVYHLNAEDNVQIIYPNFWDKDNFLKANTTRVIPENSSLPLYAPYGEERVLVYASLRPFNIPDSEYSLRPITQEMLNSAQAMWRIESSNDGSKGTSVTPRGATGQASYTIAPRK